MLARLTALLVSDLKPFYRGALIHGARSYKYQKSAGIDDDK
jgi:hypothetical protein